MSTESQSAPDLSARSILQSLNTAYANMEMSLERYLLLVIGPAFGFFVGAAVVVVVLGLPLFVALPVVLLGLLFVVVAIIYPKLAQDRKRKQVRQRFHLFLTHITVLSMTNINRVEIFRTLAEEDEYDALAEEMGYLVALVDTWNMSLDDACRLRAKQTSSPLLTDFLERLAYTVGGGQGIDEFLVEEQDTIIQQFVTRYESDLAKLDVMKELYMSMMLSVAFILVFAIVLPILVGISPTLLIAGTIAMFAIVQVAFVYAIHVVSPYDPLWYIEETAGPGPLSRIPRALAIGIGCSLVLAVVVLLVLLGLLPIAADRIPLPIMAAIPVTPLLLPGWRMRQEESKVKVRDGEFPSFIRALGAVESVKQTSTGNVLESLRRKDFGALTANVDALYKRLNMRIDDIRSWRLFAAETGSYLIQKFGDMYVVGRQMGGDPKVLGKVISQNQNQVLKVREQRQQATTTLTGVLYGITAASVFAFFIGLEVVEIMMEITTEMNLDGGSDAAAAGAEGAQVSGGGVASDFLHTEQYNLGAIEYLLIMTILINAMLSSIMIRITDRGHMISSLVHFVLLTWLGAIIAVVTKYVVNAVIAV
ncbi:archaellar assembly protein FlaJ [Natronorubrum texcoconense]|uniref:Flagellar protein FlaJ n=1 Tax=Natronorubrum texcoconense TaxID=1095776 RepID=A0A1G9FA63_9EURY|nr:archaellar assembly protein FlaJ [Natronorubrum texcoconense]SDK85260.1 flagellar protein FlaJ [Natronorubrum texcoconense]